MARMRRYLVILPLLLLCGTAMAKVVPGYDYVPGEVIVKFQAGVAAQAKGELLRPLGGRKIQDFTGIKAEHWQVAGAVSAAVTALENDPRVAYAQPNYVLHALGLPNDTRFNDLWGMHNTGQTGGTPDADIDAVEAWDVFTGSAGVLVAVIDSGVDYSHPDLADNIWTNPGEIPGNGVDDDGNGFIDDIHGYDFANSDADPMDDNGHGSHCSGTIGGTGNNGVGVTGVNWDVSIVALKFLTAAGSGSTSAAISCMEYATALGVDVMSNSWGGGPFDAAMEAAITEAYNAGIFFVAAAGNDGTDNDSGAHYPSNYDVPNVISVMATNDNDTRVVEPGWWSSNYGATTVDIGAPGLHIWSTTPGNTYSDYSGTSMATPHVAGAMAMLRGRFPNIGVDDGKTLLMTVGNDPLVSLAGLCVSGSRLNLLKLIADPDSIAPGDVTDLAAGNLGSNWIEVVWTAPGDDGYVGRASSYDLRWSLAPITDETTWAAANQAAGEPAPEVAGTPQAMQVNGLAVQTEYHFCLRAKDEYGTYGDLSNSPAATTLGPPTISVAPSSLAATLETGGTTTETLVIANTGQGVLDFAIPTAEYLLPAKGRFGAVRAWDYDAQAKGSSHDLAPIVEVDGSGGPDAFGYNWRDSDEVGGPAFNWIEISSLGTSVTLGDDATSGQLPIGFTFPFYGTDFTTFGICSNGWLSFTSTETGPGNGPLPAVSAPGNLVALFWDDLDPATGGNIYYYNDGTRLIVEYAGINHYDSGGVYTMQAHLYPGGVIEYHYLTIVDPSNSGTVGLQNADGTDGLTTVYNSPYVHDGLAVRFVAITPWLATGPNSGSLAAGASVNVDVVISAAGLCGSTFDANLHVVSNDVLNSNVVVPVGLSLIGTPDIAVDAATLDFGPVYLTATGVLQLTVSNSGCADLNLSGLVFDHADFSTTTTVPQLLAAGASLEVPVSFAPSIAGAVAGTLTLTSDDPDTPALVVNLAGSGLDFPDIAVAPASLTENLPTGGTATQTLTITNNGLGDLNFTIPEAEYILAKVDATLPNKHAQPIELAKGEADPRVGGPVVLGAGGPDVFGYRWSDSDQPGGPAFSWVDISGIGTPIPFTLDDQNLGPFPIGFTFPFYGGSFTEFRASTNGWLSFTNTTTALTNYVLPSASAPENLLAMFHDDLNFSTAGDAYYHFDGTRLIVQYQDAPHYGTPAGGPYTFQAHLYANGRIEYHYKAMSTARLDECTIGIQNAARDDGLSVVFNAAYVHDGLAVRFQSADPWLSIAPNAGTVPPGTSLDVIVGFDASGLCESQVQANLHVLSNDPDTPDVTVPVTLNLDGQPDAVFSAADLDLGGVFLNQTASLPLTLANAGCGGLDVTELTIDNPAFTVDVAAPFSLGAGASTVLNVSYTPTVPGAATGLLTLTSNDPTNPVLTVNLAGTGLNAGSLAVNPADIHQVVHPEGVKTTTMTIANSGQGDLSFTIPSPAMYSKHVAGLGQTEPIVPEPQPKDAKDEDFGVNPLGSGGPDLYGYKWSDSDEAGGPAFNWVDIAATGTVALATGDDANAGPFPIGFPFEFYGNTFTDFRVSSNGFLSFTSTLTAYGNTALPNASGPTNLIAPFWDDLNLGATGSGDVYYQVVGGNLVVQYNSVLPYSGTNSGSGPFTFEVILTPSGGITLQYLTMVGSPASHTIGIQDGTGTVGLQVVYNAAYVHDNLAVQFRSSLDWMACTPVSGTVPAGGSVDIEVAFDAAGLALGQHNGQIEVLSDDPVTPSVIVPVILEVSDLSAVGDEVLPRVTALNQNVPNPFNPMTTIRFSLPQRGPVDLRVYDVRGALVRTLASGELAVGHHTRVWLGRNDQDQPVPSGVYFYRLETGHESVTRRMTLVK